MPVIKESEEQRNKSDKCQDDLDSLSAQEEDVSKVKFGGLEVLLVEDNVVNQKVGKRMLHTLGCNVTVPHPHHQCPRCRSSTSLSLIDDDPAANGEVSARRWWRTGSSACERWRRRSSGWC